MTIHSDLKVVELFWHKRITIESDPDDNHVLPALPEKFDKTGRYYCIYGQHPVYGGNVLLYIGETKNGKNINRSIRSRLSEHFSGRFWDHTDLEVTIGTTEEELTHSEICAVESILIAAHKPALNRKHIDCSNADSRGIIVHNYGYIRSLASECSGRYWAAGT